MAFQYIAFYKPYKVLSQFSTDDDKETLSNYLDGIEKDIYPVGRLDYDSEGLIILTNDKSINNRLLNPVFAHRKTYWIQVENTITKEAIKQLEEGVVISVNGNPYKTKSAKVEILNGISVADRNPPIRYRKDIPTTWISLTITEGKNRQVRKMTAAVGCPTLRLIRRSIGSISLDEMKPGEAIMLNEKTKELLFK